jgi:hypothetical protein
MNYLNIYLSMILLIVINSCSSDLFDMSIKGNKDPETTSPTVKSFLVERSLITEWANDKYCDEYILYRDTSPAGNFNSIVYMGTGTGFNDTKLIDDTFYYYKLAKRLGNKEFPKSNYIPGVSTFSRQDEYEYNNTKETAKKLDSTTNANIYYYKDAAGNEFEDVDWYYVHLEASGSAKSSVRLIINEYSANVDPGDIQYNIEGQVPQSLFQGQPFDIANGKTTVQDIYFQISVNKNKIANPFLNKMGDYKLSIVYYE